MIRDEVLVKAKEALKNLKTNGYSLAIGHVLPTWYDYHCNAIKALEDIIEILEPSLEEDVKDED